MTDEFDLDEIVKKAILASGQKETIVCYSAYETDENDEPINNLDKIAAPGRIILVADLDNYWGGKGSMAYRSDELLNPTWLQVAVCANAMVQKTGDEHHVFLEGIEKVGEENGVDVYEFCMGS